MSGVQLARFAAQAEFFRLRALLRRQAFRAIFAGVAVLFALAALAGGHVAGVLALCAYVTPMQAILIVAGLDLIVAIIFAAIASRDVPGAVEREALALRRATAEQAIEAVAVATLINRVVRARSWRDFSDLLTSAVAAWAVAKRG